MNKKATKNNGYPEPCTSNLLWFVHELADEKGMAILTIEHIMTEFHLNSGQAKALLDSLCGFAERVRRNKYQLTKAGWEEIDFLRKFVNVGAKRGWNRKQSIIIETQFRNWLGVKVPEGVSSDDASFLARLLKPNKKNKWTEEEIEKGWDIYTKWNGGKANA